MAQRGPKALRMARISLGEATLPSSPASRASVQRWSTWPSTEEAMWSSYPRAVRSRLVSTVTARTSGRATPSVCAAAAAPWAAACIMARPPEAGTLNMTTPSRTASRAAPSTVLGMSWNLRSRNTSPPRLRTASTAGGPKAVKSCEPILKRLTCPARVSTSPTARSMESTSRATMSRSLGSRGMVVLEGLHGHLSFEERLDAAYGSLGAVHGGVVGDVQDHRRPPDEVGVLAGAAIFGRVEDQRDFSALHQIDDVGPELLGDLVDELHRHALPGKELGRPRGGDQSEAHVGEALGHLEHRTLVAVLHGQEDLARGGQGRACRELRLDVGLAEVAVDAHDLARGLHLGAEEHVHPGELDEGEDRFLHRDVPQLALGGQSEVDEAPAQHDLGGELGQGDADGLGDEGDGARGARVDLEHVERLVLDGELDVEEADDAELPGKRARLFLDPVDLIVAQGIGRQCAGGVARVDARLLDVLHDAAHDHALAICDGVHVHLQGILEELVHEDGMLGADAHRFAHVGLEVLAVVDDLHRTAAQHIGGPHEHGIADALRDALRLLEGARGVSGRLLHPEV